MRGDRILLLHGWGGSDHPHWQAVLAATIASNYGTVSFPLIQHPHFPNLNRWRREIHKALEGFSPNVAVCHSLGSTLWLHLCDTADAPPLERLYLVSVPSLNTKHKILESFFPAPKPKSLYAEKATIVISDNDPWMDTTEARELALHYGAKLKIIKGAGHINEESGYGRWEWIEREVIGEKHK